MRTTDRSDTELVLAARNDGGEAYGELFNRWFNSSWNVARNIVRQDDMAADVAQDALLTAWQRLDQLEDPDAFGGWLLRITRNRALNRLEREQRSKATGDDVVSGLRDKGLPDPTGAEPPLRPDSISEVRDRQELVWAASAALGEKEASLLDLHLRHGLSPAEIADELGVEANNAHQQLYRLRTKLGDAIGSYLLWRNGRPLCDGLAQAVSGDVAFDKSVARAVVRHQKSCEHCSQRRASLVDPGKLFAAVPMVLVPTQLKLQAAAGLQSAGVSFGSSANSAGSNGADGTSGTDRVEGADTVNGGDAPSGSESAPADGPQAPNIRSGSGSGPKSGPRPLTTMSEMSTRSKKTLLGAGAVTVAVLVGLALLLTQRPDDSVAAIASEAGENLAAPELSASEGDNGDDEGGTAQLTPAEPPAADTDDADPQVETPPDAPPETVPAPREQPETNPGAESGTDDPVTTPPTVTVPEEDDPLPEVTDPPRDSTPPTPEVTDPPREPDPPDEEEEDPTGRTDPGTDTTAEPPPPPPPPPEIIRFSRTRPGGPLLCADSSQGPFQANWVTQETESITLWLANGTSRSGGPDGSYKFCGTTGDVIRLVATGPGGSMEGFVTL